LVAWSADFLALQSPGFDGVKHLRRTPKAAADPGWGSKRATATSSRYRMSHVAGAKRPAVAEAGTGERHRLLAWRMPPLRFLLVLTTPTTLLSALIGVDSGPTSCVLLKPNVWRKTVNKTATIRIAIYVDNLVLRFPRGLRALEPYAKRYNITIVESHRTSSASRSPATARLEP
jgi:hypothetical protein